MEKGLLALIAMREQESRDGCEGGQGWKLDFYLRFGLEPCTFVGKQDAQ